LEELECMEKCNTDVLITELIENQRKIKANYELYYDKKTRQILDQLLLLKYFH